MAEAAPVADPFLELRNSLPWLQSASMKQAVTFYREALHEPVVVSNPAILYQTLAILGRGDRFFLLTHLLHRPDAVHPWLYDRCREVEANPDGCLDLWARDHYKSTIITFAGAIQEIVRDPEITIGIFSHTRPIAKKFLAQIANELERNDDLKNTYADVLYANPRRESPSWSIENGIVVKRLANPKEKTVEAWGLVDGQPTSAHFRLGIFDDTVTRESVTTGDQIVKTTDAWELAQNLLSAQSPRRWMIGTRYKYGDTYHQLLERGAVNPRVYPATHDGTFDGIPVFLRPEVWAQKKAESSTATIAAQQLQNPSAGTEQELKPEWIRAYEVRPMTLNVYIMGDYAGGRPNVSKSSSNTAFAVVGVDANLNKYLLDGAVHKMTLTQRWEMLRNLRRKWLRAPGVQVVEVGYERYGAQSDIEHFETMMQIEGESFSIEELNWPRDGDGAKDNRIRRLEPDLRNWRFFFPYNAEQVKAERLAKQQPIEGFDDLTKRQREAMKAGQDYLVAKPIKAINEDNKVYDLVEWFTRNEYLFFPNTTKKDFLDALSRIYDMNVSAPMLYGDSDLVPAVAED